MCRHSAEIAAGAERRRRGSRSGDRALPAAYVAIYPYKPQKPDELELKKGGQYKNTHTLPHTPIHTRTTYTCQTE